MALTHEPLEVLLSINMKFDESLQRIKQVTKGDGTCLFSQAAAWQRQGWGHMDPPCADKPIKWCVLLTLPPIID